MPKSCVAYYRVSTERQGKSGLGLDAQRQAVSSFLQTSDMQLINEFVEVESGKKADRPELMKALELCRRKKAILIIAKLDRLSRNVAFISGLMESSVDFVAVDMPHANRLTIHILAAVAEHEREMISMRTKASLAAAKARGKKLGFSNEAMVIVQKSACIQGAETNRQNADQFAKSIAPLVKDILQSGRMPYATIAMIFNARGIPTPRGGVWHAQSIKNLIQRLNKC
ncbi:MAG: recombinase family protein [Magnetococcales bacterium]|nr:recombinase family protein [Magnetococcales bacterium]